MVFNMVAFFSTWSSWFSTWFGWYSTWLCLFQLQSSRKLLSRPPGAGLVFPKPPCPWCGGQHKRICSGSGHSTRDPPHKKCIPHRPVVLEKHVVSDFTTPRQHLFCILHLVVVPNWAPHTACRTIMRETCRDKPIPLRPFASAGNET